ncbi:MAG: hypothetical protein WAU27_00410, partial [Pseudomonadales bacterium]
WIACQITSNPYADRFAVTIEEADFLDGNLARISFARPGKLFTEKGTGKGDRFIYKVEGARK